MKDIYTNVTNSIITALEQGTPPWVRPWQDGQVMPSNLATGKPYRGINVLMLNVEAMARNHSDCRWLTFRQAKELGTHVRKGERGTPIVFYRLREIKGDTGEAADGDAPDRRSIPMLKSYTVFNASQLDHVPERLAHRPAVAWQPIDEAEQVLIKSGATICHGGNQAFYRPSDDIIKLPPSVSFGKPEDYYATALHELCHWTGHQSRLNRVLGGRRDIEAYAYEELVQPSCAPTVGCQRGLSTPVTSTVGSMRCVVTNGLSSLRLGRRRRRRILFWERPLGRMWHDRLLST